MYNTSNLELNRIIAKLVDRQISQDVGVHELMLSQAPSCYRQQFGQELGASISGQELTININIVLEEIKRWLLIYSWSTQLWYARVESYIKGITQLEIVDLELSRLWESSTQVSPSQLARFNFWFIALMLLTTTTQKDQPHPIFENFDDAN